MTMTIKPDMTQIWANTGAKVQPPEAKIASGWGYEMMPFEWENWIQNRNDSMLSHINQRGIPEWDANTEYFANKSYVTGSNGLVYVALVNNTNVNPVADATGKWTRAFPSTTGGGASGTWSISVGGNAATATQLATARTINGISFNGTANITVEPYVERDDSTNATRYLTFVDSSAAGHQRLNMDTALSFNPSTNTLSASTTGNAATATKLANARTIAMSGDVTWSPPAFDGSANISATSTLSDTGVTPGTYQTSTTITPFTVDSKGRVTSVGTTTTISPAWASITNKPTTVAGYGITDVYTKAYVDSIQVAPDHLNIEDVGVDPNQIPLNQFLGDLAYQTSRSLVLNPAASVRPHESGNMVFELTSDTTLKIKVKGSDGITRYVQFTLGV